MKPSLPSIARPAAALALACLLTAASARAEVPRPGPWGLGLETGILKLQDGDWDYSGPGPFAGLALSRELHPHWSVLARVRAGRDQAGVDEPFDQAGWSSGSSLPLYTAVTQTLCQVRYRFDASRRYSPFFGLGCGVRSWKVIRTDGSEPGWFPGDDPVTGYDLAGDEVPLEGKDFLWEVAFGVGVALGGNLGISAEAFYQVGQGNDRDSSGLSSVWGPAHVDANRAAGGGLVGLTWRFGAFDGDGDGVPDHRDACPDNPEDRDGFNDNDGCPDPDNDQDGIPDARDLCPELAEDFDGYEDEDGCPEVDNDQDGVLDGRDRCPDTPPGTLVDRHGCPLDSGRGD